MIELGYFALGFAAGVVFVFSSLIAIARWLKRVTEPPPHEAVQRSPVKKQETMWN